LINTVEHNILIDFGVTTSTAPDIKIKQQDVNSHKFIFTVTENGTAYNLTGLTARVYFLKSDSTAVYQDCTLDTPESGILSTLLTTQCLTVSGFVSCEVVLYGTANELLTAASFLFRVLDLDRDDAVIESTSEFTALNASLTIVNDAYNEYSEALGISVASGALEIVDARGIYPTLGDRSNNVDNQLNNIATSVKSFSCDDGQYVQGDGIHDDTTGIQAAINYVGNLGGGKIYFPKGDYLVNNTGSPYCLTVQYNNIEFCGLGNVSKIFSNRTDAFTLIYFYKNAATVENCSIHDLCFEGVYSSNSNNSGIACFNVKGIKICNNYVKNFKFIGIALMNSASLCTIEGNIVTNCYYTSININGYSGLNTVKNNKCDICNTTMIQVTGHCVVDANSLSNCVGSGIHIGEGNWYGEVTVANNMVRNCNVGIHNIYHGGAIITGNTVINCYDTADALQSVAIYADDPTNTQWTVATKNCIISNNKLINNLRNIYANTDECIITNNQLVYLTGGLITLEITNHLVNIADLKPILNIFSKGLNSIITGNLINGGVQGIMYTMYQPFEISNNIVLNIDNNANYIIESPYVPNTALTYCKNLNFVCQTKLVRNNVIGLMDYTVGDTVILDSGVKYNVAFYLKATQVSRTGAVFTVDDVTGVLVGDSVFTKTTANLISPLKTITDINGNAITLNAEPSATDTNSHLYIYRFTV